MHSQISLGRAEAYLSAHLSRSGQGHFSRPVGPFVTISRESGAGGSTFARALAPRLKEEWPGETPWTVFGRDMVERMLLTRNLSPRIARFLPEDKVSEIDASVGELIGLHPSLWELIQRTNEMMRSLARSGHVILVGRGGRCATAAVSNGLHLRLVASDDYRATRMMQVLGVTRDAAIAHNQHADDARRKYVKSVFDADTTRANAYDLVINTGSISIAEGVEMVASLMRARSEVSADRPAAVPASHAAVNAR